MALPNRREFDQLLGKWSNRTSTLQSILKDAWEIPVVRDLLAPLGVGATVTAGGLSDATSGYATAFVLGAVAYLTVWARLNLVGVFARVLRRADQHEIEEENKNDNIFRRKGDLSRFMLEDFKPARDKLFDIADHILDIIHPDVPNNHNARIDYRRVYLDRHYISGIIRVFEKDAYERQYFSTLQSHASRVLEHYQRNMLSLVDLVNKGKASVSPDLYREWYTDDALMMRRLEKLMQDSGYYLLSEDIPLGWGKEERRLLPAPKGAS